MKKGLLLVAALGVLSIAGCEWPTCKKEAKTAEKAATKEVKATEKAAN